MGGVYNMTSFKHFIIIKILQKMLNSYHIYQTCQKPALYHTDMEIDTTSQ